MAAISRRSIRTPIGTPVTLATADDLNGTSNGSQVYQIDGLARAIILQVNDGTSGTTGIDVIEYSTDNVEWSAATDVLPVGQNDLTGTVQASGALNTAGAEPSLYAAFKIGPFEGPTYVRCSRGAAGSGTAWQTGAPSVLMVPINGPAGGGALSAEA